MKTLSYFFVMAVILIAGCAKDDTMFETPENLELKNAKVPIPFKADLYAVTDMDSDPILIEVPPGYPEMYNPSRLIVSGTGSHLGRVDAEKSFYEFERMVFFFDENGVPFLTNTGTGKLVGANGDGMEYTFTVTQNQLDGTCIGIAEIIPGSGTGKFEGCAGSIDIVGGWHEDGVGLWFKIQGDLVYE